MHRSVTSILGLLLNTRRYKIWDFELYVFCGVSPLASDVFVLCPFALSANRRY